MQKKDIATLAGRRALIIVGVAAIALLAPLGMGCSKDERSIAPSAPLEEAIVDRIEENIAADEAAGEQQEVEAIGEAIGEAEAIEETEEGGREGAALAGTGVEACDRYLDTFERYLSCPQIPKQMQEASRLVSEQMRKTWADLRSAGLKSEMERGCSDALEGIRQGASAFGCRL